MIPVVRSGSVPDPKALEVWGRMRAFEKLCLAWALAAAPATALAQAPAAGATFRDCADCPEMVVVPAGTYRMGSTKDRALSDFETPRHEVRIGAAFAVARIEVSRGQFAAFVGETGYAAFQGKGCDVLRHADLQWVETIPATGASGLRGRATTIRRCA